MKIKLLLFIAILFEILYPRIAFTQTHSKAITDEEIYTFISSIIHSDKRNSEEPFLGRKNISIRIIKFDSTNFFTKIDTAKFRELPYFGLEGNYIYQIHAGIDTIFKQEDRDFLFQQFVSIRDTVWHHRFRNSSLITNWHQKHTNLFYYSIPLFSLDRNYVLIKKHYTCGNLCGKGCINVYQRIGKNKWKCITQLNCIQS